MQYNLMYSLIPLFSQSSSCNTSHVHEMAMQVDCCDSKECKLQTVWF